MQLTIVSSDKNWSEASRRFAERRLRFALSRYSPRIRRVSTIIDDQACQITVRMRGLNDVVVTCAHAQLELRVALAADRVGRAVSRAVEGQLQFDRQRPFVA